jgi:hypothetical protein
MAMLEALPKLFAKIAFDVLPVAEADSDSDHSEVPTLKGSVDAETRKSAAAERFRDPAAVKSWRPVVPAASAVGALGGDELNQLLDKARGAEQIRVHEGTQAAIGHAAPWRGCMGVAARNIRCSTAGQISLKRDESSCAALKSVLTLQLRPPPPCAEMWLTLAACVRYQARKRQRLSSKLVIDIVHQLALALEHALVRGVCHRDLRLETIDGTMAGSSMHVRLSGFDRACSRSDRDARRLPALSRGSMSYRAPELLLDAHECAMLYATSDVWSLGCVFARLLNTEPIFIETADSEEKVLTDLFRKLGTPPLAAIKAITGDSEATGLLKVLAPRPWGHIIKHKKPITTIECRLLSRMLDWNPATRGSAASLLPYLHPRARILLPCATHILAAVVEDDAESGLECT